MNETQAKYFATLETTAATQTAFQTAFQAVRARAFIVGSVSEDGKFSISAKPVTHPTLTAAKAEAARLAKLNPGTSYVPMQLAGGFMVPRITGVAEF